ncbi:hypothetical protein PIB30_096608, partial [Stylosanthes scabra]|nr:hypothetical protein [Stylosanthes scabra]
RLRVTQTLPHLPSPLTQACPSIASASARLLAASHRRPTRSSSRCCNRRLLASLSPRRVLTATHRHLFVSQLGGPCLATAPLSSVSDLSPRPSVEG